MVFATISHFALAAPPRAVPKVAVADRPNDRGDGVQVTWSLSPDDTSDIKTTGVLTYDVLRREVAAVPEEIESGGSDNSRSTSGQVAGIAAPKKFESVGSAPYSVGQFDDGSCSAGQSYEYQVVAVGTGKERSPATLSDPVTPTVDWFNTSKAWYGVLLLLFCGTVVACILLAKSGHRLWLRQIPALKAVDEAVGRATEMGRPCLYVTGMADIDEMPTIASLTVLSRVARTVAEYDAELEVPTARSLVMAAARETVQGAYLAAGHPEAFRPDSVHYLTDEQFGYASAVAGSMARNRPAACFYFGQFYAESLFLAETGQSVGAIQIAGTNETSQLPFFVAACDYTLIGEEFFAASAYLSGEPQQLGSIKGQDAGKLLAAVLVLGGTLLATLAALVSWGRLQRAVDYLTNVVLSSG